MSRLLELFPEISRYLAQEAGKTRLVSGGAAVLALCLATAYSVAHTTGEWKDYLAAVTFMQFNMLLFYGALCTAKSVTQERAERTWDFQRLTPLSSFRLAAGKFLGAPVFPWFLFAAMLPAALVPAAMAPGGYWEFFCRYALGTSCALLFMAVGLLASAYDDSGGGGMGLLSGPLAGLIGLGVLNAAFNYRDHLAKSYGQPLSFYGWEMGEVSSVLFLTASFLAFAAWAFLGARYRIGRDLLERRRLWRLPAFLFFLAWYLAGVGIAGESNPGMPLNALTLTSLAAYISGVLSCERREYWRRWLSGENAAVRLDEAPAWMKGAASLLAIGAGLAAVQSFTGLFGHPASYRRLFFILPLFLLRDMLFLQWCRFSASRRPEMMALAYIALAYALPVIILGPTGLSGFLPAFVPYVKEGMGAAANLAGPLAQVLITAYALFRKIKPAVDG